MGSTAAEEFADIFALSHNTNLEELDIDINSDAGLRLLENSFNFNAKPSLRQLTLRLSEKEYLEKWSDTWSQLDNVLSTMTLKNSTPKLSVKLPRVLVAEQHAYMEVSLLRVKKLLPRTANRWGIEVGLR